jgi:hypothetical protein
MAKIKEDKHGLYFIYNGNVWRPVIPEKEKSIASARKMLPNNDSTLNGYIAKPRNIEDFFIHVNINDIDYLWYNHGIKKTGIKSELVYRDFKQEDNKIQELIGSGLTPKEAYAIFWKSLCC